MLHRVLDFESNCSRIILQNLNQPRDLLPGPEKEGSLRRKKTRDSNLMTLVSLNVPRSGCIRIQAPKWMRNRNTATINLISPFYFCANTVIETGVTCWQDTPCWRWQNSVTAIWRKLSNILLVHRKSVKIGFKIWSYMSIKYLQPVANRYLYLYCPIKL